MLIWRRVAAVAAVVLAVAFFSVGLPRLAEAGPSSVTAEGDTEVDLVTATIVVPGGWQVGVADAADGVLTASLEGVTVVATDAIWFGTSADLMVQVDDLMAKSAGDLPQVPSDAVGLERELWIMPVDGSQAEPDGLKQIAVVRQDITAIVVRVYGREDDIAAAQDQIDAMIASIELIDVDVSVGSES